MPIITTVPVTAGAGLNYRAQKDDGNVITPAFYMEPQALGGLSVYRNIDIDETGQVIKSSPGTVSWYHFWNAHATDTVYVKLYNKATTPTNSDTPKLTIPVGASGGANVAIPHSLGFDTGIGIRATTGLADNSTGAPATNQCIVNIGYI